MVVVKSEAAVAVVVVVHWDPSSCRGVLVVLRHLDCSINEAVADQVDHRHPDPYLAYYPYDLD